MVVAKFHRYLAVNTPPERFDVRPFLKVGVHRPGDAGRRRQAPVRRGAGRGDRVGGPGLAVRDQPDVPGGLLPAGDAPIKALFTRAGMVGLTETMIQVLRWGLWMSPIIKSFLRPMGDPTWYNQDGAIRTLLATYHDAHHAAPTPSGPGASRSSSTCWPTTRSGS